MDVRVKPEFAELPLHINADNFDDYDDVASYQFPILNQKLAEKIRRPERNAIRNYLGYLAACLGWNVESIALFNSVLSEDQNNLNALENLKCVFRDLGWKRRQEDLAERLKQLQVILDRNDDRGKVIKARCLAEKGYAIRYGVSYEYEQEFVNACKMYDTALEIAGGLVSIEEKVDWSLGRVRVKQILFTKQTHWRGAKEDVEFETRMISDILEVIRLGDNTMKAEAWVIMAAIFRRLHRNAKFVANGASPPKCLQQDQELLTMYRKQRASVTCYDKALQYIPGNPEIQAKKANALKVSFYDTQPDYKTAFDLLDQSIMVDGSISNRLVYSVRGETYMDLYRLFREDRRGDTKYLFGQLRKDRTERDDNVGLLIEAKSDYERSLKIHTEPADSRQLGDIWRYLSREKSATILRTVGKTTRQCLEKALEYYTVATEMVPAGSTNPHVHWKRGECLLELNKPAEAAESYKSSIECYRFPCDSMKRTYGRLFEAHLRLLDPADNHFNVALVQEAAKWLKRGKDMFGERVLHSYWFEDNRVKVNGLRVFNRICRDIGEDYVDASAFG